MAARIPTLDLVKNYSEVKDEMLEAIRSVLESQSFIMGPEVRLFEEECESYLEGVSAVGCASGTDALLLALMALDVGEGDEVITTPYSFFATASSIVRLGAVPVFVDVDPKTYNIDLEKAVSAITPRTKAYQCIFSARWRHSSALPSSRGRCHDSRGCAGFSATR